ncbi:MAG: hypothetical protein J6D53_10890 [Blautia sp.]|nr:hypothetical protein [Blautia sp.]
MKNEIFINTLLEEKKSLEGIISKAKRELKKAPEGTVQIKKHYKGYQFYHRRLPTEKNGKYIPAAERKKALALVKKRYLQRVVKSAGEQVSLIGNFLDGYDPEALDKIYNSEGDIRKKLITPIVMPDDLFIEDWTSVAYQGKTIHEDVPEHYTNKNERVRSKSEVIIANALAQANIPYRYEYPMEVLGKIIYPDFTILRIKDRKEIIWEHLGMVDDEEYLDRAFRRIREYEAEGIFPGKDLVITFETTRIPLNSKVVEAMIKQYLL